VLSDRHRTLVILALIAGLVGLCGWYAWQADHKVVGYARCMSDPAAHDGVELSVALWRVVRVEPQGYRISGMVRDVPVIADSAGLEPGMTVSVVGRFDAQRAAVVETHREIHHARGHKSALGLLGLLGFLIYAVPRFRWREGRLVLHG
jgi:hypothetical protein